MWLFFLFSMGCNPEIQAQPNTAIVKERRRGWLGVRFQETATDVSSSLGFAQPLIRVEMVVNNSPAAASGVQEGMLISHIDDERVSSKRGFIEHIQAKGAGETIKLRHIASDRSAKEIVVTLGDRPSESALQKDMFIGNKGSSFEYTDYSSKEKVEFSPSQGKVVLLDFWATWCGPCLMSMPNLKDLHEKYSDQGLEIIGITDEALSKIRPVAKRYDIPYTLGSNRSYSAFQKYSVQSLPTAVLIDKNGVIREVFIGAGHGRSLQEKIVALLEE